MLRGHRTFGPEVRRDALGLHGVEALKEHDGLDVGDGSGIPRHDGLRRMDGLDDWRGSSLTRTSAPMRGSSRRERTHASLSLSRGSMIPDVARASRDEMTSLTTLTRSPELRICDWMAGPSSA